MNELSPGLHRMNQGNTTGLVPAAATAPVPIVPHDELAGQEFRQRKANPMGPWAPGPLYNIWDRTSAAGDSAEGGRTASREEGGSAQR